MTHVLASVKGPWAYESPRTVQRRVEGREGVRRAHGSFETIARSRVTLAPEATVYFNAGYSDVMPPCADVPASLTARTCDNGTAHVSAIFGSTDADATKSTAPLSH